MMINWDLDKNGFPALTERNVELVNFIIENDSSYRSASDKNNPNSSAFLFDKKYAHGQFPMDFKTLLDVVTRIDQENSTHVSVSSNKKAKGISNQGRKIMARKLSMVIDLEKRLAKPCPCLVDDIAKYVQGRNNFSFASKFCTYMCQGAFTGTNNQDNYSIFDTILSNALPYYAWVYLGKNYAVKGKSIIRKTYAEKGKTNYAGYQKLIDDIRDASEKIYSYPISRRDLDHLLWYYFKGNEDRISASLKCVGDSTEKL
jgi:hypothetical protein